MAEFRYRLQPLLEQKTEAREKAEHELAARRAALREAQEQLDRLTSAVAALSEERAAARRSLVGDGGSMGVEVNRRVDDVAILGRRLEAARDEVFAQRLTIEEREEEVVRAKQAVTEATREEEVLKKHKEKSRKRWSAELERKEEAEQEEIASAMYETRRRR